MKLKFCAECLVCCHWDGFTDIILAKSDIKHLLAEYIRKDGSVARFKKNKNKDCYYLTAKGCSLGNKKPFDCKIFPFTFNYKDGKLELFLQKSCPHYGKITKKQIESVKREIRREIKKWSKEELAAYSGAEMCDVIKIK